MSAHKDSFAGRAHSPARAALVVALALALAVGLVWATGCNSSTTSTTETTVAGESTSTTSPVSGTIYPGGGETTTTTSPVTGTIYPSTSSTLAGRLDKVTLVAPPGPMAIPLEYLKLNNKLSAIADQTDLVIWENADQLKAIVTGGKGDFITMPSNNAAIFYNKGVALQLLDISVWNITYLVTRDSKAASLKDIKGQSLVVSLQGSVPDLMFQYLAKKEGLDPTKDFKLQYVTDPTAAAQLLIAGKVNNAVLSEALATSALLQTQSASKPLRKAFAFDKAWAGAVGKSALTPIAGTVAMKSVTDKPQVISVFEREYRAAVDWMLANPEEAGKLVETELPELGLKADVMTTALQGITWTYTRAGNCRMSLESFYKALSELSPDVIGGKLPDDGFYYVP